MFHFTGWNGSLVNKSSPEGSNALANPPSTVGVVNRLLAYRSVIRLVILNMPQVSPESLRC